MIKEIFGFKMTEVERKNDVTERYNAVKANFKCLRIKNNHFLNFAIKHLFFSIFVKFFLVFTSSRGRKYMIL